MADGERSKLNDLSNEHDLRSLFSDSLLDFLDSSFAFRCLLSYRCVQLKASLRGLSPYIQTIRDPAMALLS